MNLQLKKGQTGPDVRQLQEHLKTRGYHLLIDGVFGKKTYQAVRAFQSQNLDQHGQPLSVDGKVGPITWWSLNNDSPTGFDWHTMPPLEAGGSNIGRMALSIAIAEMQAGAREIGGNNMGQWVRKYLNPTGLPEGNSWCAAFVSWCFLQAANGDASRMPFRYDPLAKGIRRQFVQQRLATSMRDNYHPLPGDLVVWWRDSPESWKGHIGIVHQVKDGILYTIEGNRSKSVEGFKYVAERVEKLLGFCKLLD